MEKASFPKRGAPCPPQGPVGAEGDLDIGAILGNGELGRLLFSASRDPMLVCDAQNKVAAANPAALSYFGKGESDLVGRDPKELAAEERGSAFWGGFWRELAEKGSWRGVVRNRRADGASVALEMTVSEHRGDLGVALWRLASYREAALPDDGGRKDAASSDPLTGLPNRALFSDRLETSLEAARRSKGHVAALFIDLDGFKLVNDTHGHAAGDAVLMAASERMRKALRASDTLARISGDEFGAVLSSIKRVQDAEVVAGHILAALEEPIEVPAAGSGGGTVHVEVGASIGISVFPLDARVGKELLAKADQAMYAAKRAGKGRFQYFTDQMQREARERLELRERMEQAFAAEQFETHYHPVGKLSADGRIVGIAGFEALIRWVDPLRGPVPPQLFLQVAEEANLLASIDDWVQRRAQREMAEALSDPWSSLRLYLNKSSKGWRQAGSVERWVEMALDAGVQPRSLVFECKEETLGERDSDEMRRKLVQAKALGAMSALDDFGAGAASISRLRFHPFGALKIDRGIIQLLRDPQGRAAAEAITQMAKPLKLEVVAVGAQTEEDLKILGEMGVGFAQGDAVGAPMEAAKALELAKRLG